MANTLRVAVTDHTFDAQVFKPDILVLVDFRATWCTVCQSMVPMVEEVARDYAGRLKVVSMDVDDSSGTAFRQRVRHVPTLILFANGQEVARLEGAVSSEHLLSCVLPYLRLDCGSPPPRDSGSQGGGSRSA